jgi:hypothetical protein
MGVLICGRKNEIDKLKTVQGFQKMVDRELINRGMNQK